MSGEHVKTLYNLCLYDYQYKRENGIEHFITQNFIETHIFEFLFGLFDSRNSLVSSPIQCVSPDLCRSQLGHESMLELLDYVFDELSRRHRYWDYDNKQILTIELSL